jgi:hypothetical protein
MVTRGGMRHLLPYLLLPPLSLPLFGSAISGLQVHVVKGGQHDMLVQPQFTDQIVELMDNFLSSSPS